MLFLAAENMSTELERFDGKHCRLPSVHFPLL
jgi:hypothetical protein